MMKCCRCPLRHGMAVKGVHPLSATQGSLAAQVPSTSCLSLF